MIFYKFCWKELYSTLQEIFFFKYYISIIFCWKELYSTLQENIFLKTKLVFSQIIELVTESITKYFRI